MPCQQNNPGMAERKLVYVSGNRSWSASVTALIPFWMQLELESMRLYKKCDTEVLATSHHNAI